MIAEMPVDTFKIFRTTKLPDDSVAWVVIAVHADEKKNFVREVHIARASGLGGLVVLTDFARNDATNDSIEECELKEAQNWACQYFGNEFLRDPDFERGEFKLVEVTSRDVLFAKYDAGLPEAFDKIRNATESTALREWLNNLNQK